MRILIITQYFWPENFQINDIASQLTSIGHDVEILTGKPNYPSGKVFSGYSAWGYAQEQIERNIKIHRIPTIARGVNSGIRLIGNYLWFSLCASFYVRKLCANQEFDATLVYAPSPITSAIPSGYARKKYGIPNALWVQDLWPDSVSATGYVKNGFLLKLIKVIVRKIYKNMDLLLIQSPDFQNPIQEIFDHKDIRHFPNSVKRIDSETDDKRILPDSLNHIFQDCFSVVFTGNIGKAQSIDSILDAAEILKGNRNIKIVLIGDGSERKSALREVEMRELNNVYLPGSFDVSFMPSIYEKSSLLMVSLLNEEIFNRTIPSKLQMYLASGRPVIGSLNGSGADVITNSGAGISCEAENAQSLADSILSMSKWTEDKLDNAGLKGKQYFMENFELETCTNKLSRILQELSIKRKSK